MVIRFVRMVSTTQDFYFVQYIAHIDNNVIEHLDAQVGREANRRGNAVLLFNRWADTIRFLKPTD